MLAESKEKESKTKTPKITESRNSGSEKPKAVSDKDKETPKKNSESKDITAKESTTMILNDSVKKSTSKKTSPPQKQEAEKAPVQLEQVPRRYNFGNTSSAQTSSVILFTVSVFLLLLTLMEGKSAWKFLHDGLRGLFGVAAFSLPLIFIYLSVSMAFSETEQIPKGRTRHGIELAILISAIAQIFMVGKIEGEKFEIFRNLFRDGIALKGGGVASFFIAYPLLKLFDSTGATIIVVLLLFTVLMLIGNLTLMDLFQVICYPFNVLIRFFRNGIYTEYDDDYEYYDMDEKPYYNNRRVFTEETRQMSLDEETPQQPEKLIPVLNRKESKRIGRKKNMGNPKEQMVNMRLPQYRMPEKEVTMEDYDIPLVDHVQPKMSMEIPKTADHFFDIPLLIDEETVTADAVQRIVTAQKKTESEKKIEPKTEISPEKTEGNSLQDIIAKTVRKENQKEDIPRVTEDPSVPVPEYLKKENQAPLQMDQYQLPSTDLLKYPEKKMPDENIEAELSENAKRVVSTLGEFGVEVQIVDINRGPSVTRYEVKPAPGVRINKITQLVDDIALHLAAEGVRIEAPIPGKAAVGIEIANKRKESVTLREIIESDAFRKSKSLLTFAVGKNIDGDIITGDVAKMPHLLIAGTTGSGKSVCTTGIIMSILFHAKPNEVKMILIDPKMVEFQPFEDIPHLMVPVIKDAKLAAGALNWACQEMDRRYAACATMGVKDWESYNEMVKNDPDYSPMPQILIIIDEFCDLMMQSGKEVDASIQRLAQKARAAGMYLIIATQRPTTDVITGTIKANIGSRIALRVKDSTNSRVILDESGADQLLGNGDMLFAPIYLRDAVRVQGCYTSTEEINRVVEFIKSQGAVQYNEEIQDSMQMSAPTIKGEDSYGSLSGDELIVEKAIDLLIKDDKISTSALQRKLSLGFARAGRIMDLLEEMGIVGPSEGAKPRKVLMTEAEYIEHKKQIEERIKEG